MKVEEVVDGLCEETTASQIIETLDSSIQPTILRPDGDRSHNFQRISTLKPVVSYDSIRASLVKSSSATAIHHTKLILTPAVESVKLTVNQCGNTKDRTTQPRLSCLRTKSSNEVFAPIVRQSVDELEAEQKQTVHQQPPHVIVFIHNAVQRQHRRSSLCSQITMDEAIDHSDNKGLTSNIDDDDDTNTSLDIDEVFTETKNEFLKYRKSNNYGSSDSSLSTTNSSSRNDNMLLSTTKQIPIKADVRKRSVRYVRVASKKLPRRGTGSSTNSAKQRWLQEKKDEDTSSIDDDNAGTKKMNKDDDMNESDFEDFAQDSMERPARNHLLRRVASLTVVGNATSDDNDTNNNNKNTTFVHGNVDETVTNMSPISRNIKILYGRAA